MATPTDDINEPIQIDQPQSDAPTSPVTAQPQQFSRIDLTPQLTLDASFESTLKKYEFEIRSINRDCWRHVGDIQKSTFDLNDDKLF